MERALQHAFAWRHRIAHGPVEYGVHWLLDPAFDADRARTRKHHSAKTSPSSAKRTLDSAHGLQSPSSAKLGHAVGLRAPLTLSRKQQESLAERQRREREPAILSAKP